MLFSDPSDAYYHERYTAISTADVLIIEEISMISAHILSLIDGICRHVRGSQLAMGGLQCILVGEYRFPQIYLFCIRFIAYFHTCFIKEMP
jgi:hypothetical protein